MISVDSTGLHLTTLAELQSEIGADLRAEIAPDLDLSPDQPLGQVTDIVATNFAELCDVLAYVYNSFDESSAEGVQLDNLCALTGTVRRAATKGTVLVNLALLAGVTVPAGAILAQNTNPSNQWELVSAVTSTSAGIYVGLFRSLVAGVYVAPAGTLTAIQTSVSGWTSASNPTDATPGTELETNAALRVRRRTELEAAGASTVDAIRVDLRKLSGMVSADVFENPTALTVGSLPPKTIECVVWDGVAAVIPNATIAQTIWYSKPAGILAQGTSSGTATDKLGVSRVVNFTRVAQRDAYITIFVTTDPATFPGDGLTQIQTKILEYGATLAPGSTCIRNAIEAATFAVPGVIDTPTTYLGFVAGPSASANLPCTNREIIVLDSTRINVVAT